MTCFTCMEKKKTAKRILKSPHCDGGITLASGSIYRIWKDFMKAELNLARTLRSWKGGCWGREFTRTKGVCAPVHPKSPIRTRDLVIKYKTMCKVPIPSSSLLLSSTLLDIAVDSFNGWCLFQRGLRYRLSLTVPPNSYS
jgi:hypothetical protein